jgi:hypothetical protein
VKTLCVALLALVLAGSAAAMRRPTTGEAKALRQAVAGFIAMPRSPAAKDARIVSLAVSTLDPRYASARLDSPSAGPSVLVLHLSVGGWWEVGFGSSPNCSSAPKSVLADLRVGCSPPYGVAWINTCGPLVSAPTELVLACADGNYELTKVAWRNWGRATATAPAVAVANDCTPNCAAGHFHSYPASVTATSLKTCGRARYYATLTITYPGRRPAGIGKRDVQRLHC